MSKPFRILSIDGGGIRGIYPAHILQCIEERLGVSLYESFDMIAGTSTGSIIAAAVASKIQAKEIVNLYKEHGKDIFTKKCCFPFIPPFLDSFYDSTFLNRVLKKSFGETRLGEISKPLILPATNIADGIVHVLKSAYSTDFTRDNSVLLKDAVLSSCSAPVYFSPHKLNEYVLSDGGLWANNPSLVAVIDAQKRLGISQSNIRVLSIGTGHSKTLYGTNINKRWGLFNGWKHKEFISLILSLQSQSTHNYLSLLLKKEQLLRLDFDSDKPLSLDDHSKMDDWISKADVTFTYNASNIRDFFNNEVVE